MTDNTMALSISQREDLMATICRITKELILPKVLTFTCADPETEDFSAPQLRIVERDTNRIIQIDHLPPISYQNLGYCTLERILNHIKDSYIRGEFDSEVIEQLCEQRARRGEPADFCFCATYVFYHENDTLNISFCISHTLSAPTWGTYEKNGKQVMFTPSTGMSKDEVDLMTDAFVEQCYKALSSYTALVYNDAAEQRIKPDYYGVF